MSLTTFSTPPIDEVVFGVHFTSARALRTVDMGTFWSHVISEFPTAEDRPPLLFQDPGTDQPPLRRIWLHSLDGTRLIQIQGDMFIFNWRRRSESQDYPSYKKIIQEFLTHWNTFAEWARVKGGPGEICPQQFQLSYVNHISSGNGWDGPGDTHKILKYVSPINVALFQKVESLTIGIRGLLPNNLGTLDVTAKPGMKKMDQGSALRPILVIELNAVSGAVSDISLKNWFDEAHTCVLKGFLEITTDSAQQAWRGDL